MEWGIKEDHYLGWRLGRSSLPGDTAFVTSARMSERVAGVDAAEAMHTIDK
jgi:hypothetical protein